MKVHIGKDSGLERHTRNIQTMVGASGRFVRPCAGARSVAFPTLNLPGALPFFWLLSGLIALIIAMPAGATASTTSSVADCVGSIDPPTLVTAVHVQPGAGYAPILDEINNARCSIDISMYLFTSDEIVSGLEFAEQRGVRVRVILEPEPFGTWNTQQDIFDELVAIGADVQWSPTKYEYLHAKYMVVDDSVLVVTNQNFTGAGFDSNREFGIVTTEPGYLNEATQIFANDWNGTNGPEIYEHLVVSPVNARQSILDLINGSEESVWMYAEVLRDEDVTLALDNAVARGVDVRLLVNPSISDDDAPYFLDALDQGVQIRVLNEPYVHSKALIVDGTFALIGSHNYSYTSLNLNREVGIVLSDINSLNVVSSTFLRDWTRAVPVDSISMRENSHDIRLTPTSRIGKLTSGRWGVV